jgi:hypothetical protein
MSACASNGDLMSNSRSTSTTSAIRRFDMPWGFRDPGFNGFAAVSYTF